MTIREYNNSVEKYADPVYRFIRSNLKDEERSSVYPFDLSDNKMAVTDNIPDTLTIYNSPALKSRANYQATPVNSNIQNYKGNLNTPETPALKSGTNDIQDYQVIAD